MESFICLCYAFVCFYFYFCRVKKSSKMRKEIGKWFMDIAKYVATAVLISSFLGEFQQKWIVYIVGILTVGTCLLLGMFYINDKKTKKKIIKK